MKRLLAFCLMAVLLLTLTGCGDDGAGAGFRFPLEAEPAQLDPQVSTDPAAITVLSVLFEGLTRLDDRGQPVPAGANWTVSADGRTYTFTLRQNQWSTVSVPGEETPWDEPTPVTAQDYLFGLQRALSPGAPDSLAASLYVIQNARAVHTGQQGLGALGVRTEGDDRLIITLNVADPSFPATLATTPCMPCNRAFFEYTAGRYGLEKQYLITNGPFALTAWNHGESLLLGKHEGYRDAAAVLPAAVRYVIGVDDPVESLRTGQMDAVALTAAQVEELADTDIQTVTLQDTVRSLYFNTAQTPLHNADIRRALRDAVQWETVYGYLQAQGEAPATGYLPPDATVAGEAYRNPGNSARLVTDVAAAQTALGRGLKAAYPDEKTPSLPRLTVLAPEDGYSEDLARYLIQSWQKNLKLYCTLETVPPATVEARLRAGNYQLAVCAVTLSGLTAAENLTVYTASSAENFTGYGEAAYDLAVNAALTGGRPEVTAAETLLRQACPTVPLSFPSRYYGIAAHTAGIHVRPFGGGVYGSPFSFQQAQKWED